MPIGGLLTVNGTETAARRLRYMNEKQKAQSEQKVLDMRRLISLLGRKAWIIGLTAVIAAVLTFLVSFYLIAPKYQSSTMFYVNNSSGISLDGISANISSGDLITRQDLVESYIVILGTNETLLDVLDYAGISMDCEDLREMITAESVNNTEIFRVTVTSTDPYEAEALAKAVGFVLPDRIDNIIDGTSAKIVESAVVATEPSSPNYMVNTILGFLVGMVLSISVIILNELFDVTIRSEEDIQQCCTHPVLAAVPDMTAQSKGGYYYGADRRSKLGHTTGAKEPVLVGAGISFAASEAYKLLRTKLQFSFVDDIDCHIIGVSSAMAGEGKSLSSVNLAYSLAQLDKRVLLIDCDMRRPSLAAKLPIKKLPGLSNYLTRQVGMDEVIQQYGDENEGSAFNVIAAGRNPPNPIELLNSGRMRKALDQLRSKYDYIILDLPPVGEVSDALAVSNLVDGILLVVRQNYCNRNVLSAAVNQFRFVETRILGVVMNCAEEEVGSYSKKYRGYRRYYRYEGSYMASARAAQKVAENGEQTN